MKKHFYSDELIRGIQCDPDYFLLLFKKIALVQKQSLFVPKLRRNGDYTMLCPMHNEKNPSLRLNIRTNIVKCFGCGKSGNIFTLVQEIYRVNFFQSVKIVLEIKSAPYPFSDPYPNLHQLKIPFKEYGWKEWGDELVEEKTNEDMDLTYPF